MSEITYPACIDQKLESYVARLLDEAGVPNFIWGESMLQILGVPTAVWYSGWVIPDDYIETAAKVLDEAKLPPCLQGRENCRVFKLPVQPYPDYHWHIDLDYNPEPPHCSAGVFLYRKSRLFWTFPDPPIGPPAPGDRYYMLTSDLRIRKLNPISRGRQSEDPAFHPVKMPTPARYLEAMLLLGLRDLVGMRSLMHWEIHQGYMIGWEDKFDEDRNLDVDELDEPFREWARLQLKMVKETRGAAEVEVQGDIEGTDRWTYETYVEMKRNNLLPPPDGPWVKDYRPLADRLREFNLSDEWA